MPGPACASPTGPRVRLGDTAMTPGIVKRSAVGEVLAVLPGNTDGLAGLTALAAADRTSGGPADSAEGLITA
jgi:hypothetical protein